MVAPRVALCLKNHGTTAFRRFQPSSSSCGTGGKYRPRGLVSTLMKGGELVAPLTASSWFSIIALTEGPYPLTSTLTTSSQVRLPKAKVSLDRLVQRRRALDPGDALPLQVVECLDVRVLGGGEAR